MRKAVYDKKPCPECHKSIDVRGLRAHIASHKPKLQLVTKRQRHTTRRVFANGRFQPRTVIAAEYRDGFRDGWLAREAA